MRLPTWLNGKESACQCRRRKRPGFSPWVGKIPWGRKWQSTPVFLPGKSLRQRSLAGYSPWMGSQSQIQLSMHRDTQVTDASPGISATVPGLASLRKQADFPTLVLTLLNLRNKFWSLKASSSLVYGRKWLHSPNI